MNFKELSMRFVTDHRTYVKQSTITNYMVSLKSRVLPYWGEHEVTPDNFNRKSLEKYAAALAHKGLARHTIDDSIMLLKMVLEYGEDNGYIDDPLPNLQHIRKPKIDKNPSRIKTFTVEQQNYIMDYIERHVYENIPLIGIYIAITEGLRIGEVCGLTWDDIIIREIVRDDGNISYEGEIAVNRTVERIYNPDSGRTEVVIGTPKSESSFRRVVMQPKLLEIMRELKSYSKIHLPGNYILTNTPKPNEPRTYRNQYKRFIAELGLPPLVFHCCRHTFATRCIESGVDVKVTAGFLGHADTSTTYNYYVHPSDKQKKDSMQRMYASLKR